MKKSLFLRLLRAFPNKATFVWGMTANIVFSVLTVGFSYLIRVVIDAAVDGQREVFFSVFYLAAVLLLVNFALSYIRRRLMGSYTESGVATLREAVAEKAASVDYARLQTYRSGDVLSRATNDINRVRNYTSMTLPRLIEIPLMGVLALALLIFFSWQLTLVALVLTPILVVGTGVMMKPLANASKTLQAKLADVNSVTIDTIKGVEVVKAYNLIEALEKKNDVSVYESVQSGRAVAKRRAILEAFSIAFSIIPFVTTFLLGGYFVHQGQMTVGALLAFINLLNFLTFPLSQMSVLLGEAKRDLAAAERVFEFIDEPNERTDGHAHTMKPSAPVIAFKNVSFTYPGEERPAIHKLNLSIKRGQTVAFVGPSGGGKSTVMKLLLGYYDAYEGVIAIGGYDIRDWSLEALRKQMSLVSQDTYLFPESVIENLRHGNPDASDESLINASKQANAHEFIDGFDQGYGTLIGEMGSTLSGGQKQRLSIARAMVKDAEIMLLDEATSALDTESEALVQAAMERAMKDKTAVVIAHRLSTVREADIIHVIAKGSVVESGTHDDLLDKNGLYASLYRKQSAEEGETLYETAHV